MSTVDNPPEVVGQEIRWPWPKSRRLRLALQVGGALSIALVVYIVHPVLLPRRPSWAPLFVYFLMIVLGTLMTETARRSQASWRHDGGWSPRVWGYLTLALVLFWVIAAGVFAVLEPSWDEAVTEARAVFDTTSPVVGLLVIAGVVGGFGISVHGAIFCPITAQLAWAEDRGWSPRVWIYLILALAMLWTALAVIGGARYLLDV